MITRRQTFYIPGFDPRGGRHYYNLYQQQMPLQAAVNGVTLDISSRRHTKDGGDSWTVTVDKDGRNTVTTMTILGWDDIVRQNWGKNWSSVVGQFFRVLRDYILNGVIVRIVKASPKQIAGTYPLLFVTLFLMLQGGLAVGSVVALSNLYDRSGHSAVWLLALLIPVLIWGVGRLAMRLGKALGVFWLLEIYVFCARWAHEEIPPLTPRLEQYAHQIAAAVENPDNDEVVVIGHSVGAMLAIAAIARTLSLLSERKYTLPTQRLKLITLGQCVPLVSFHAAAALFRHDLLQTAQCSQLLWLDYTAPTDGACFPLLDFVVYSGLKVNSGNGPNLLSPRFFRLFSDKKYKRLRRDWYTMHFLYIMAVERAGGYNYLDITAGNYPVSAVNQPS